MGMGRGGGDKPPTQSRMSQHLVPLEAISPGPWWVRLLLGGHVNSAVVYGGGVGGGGGGGAHRETLNATGTAGHDGRTPRSKRPPY